jgi:hypothetical protein
MLSLASSTRILEPGLWQLDPSRERYRVPACGAIVVELYPDDVLVVQDPEGGQHAEVVPFSVEGKGDPGILGIKNHNPLMVYAKFFPVILKVPVEYVLV